MLQIRYVWQWPVRITHWVNALSVVVLSVTGVYIGDPVVVAPVDGQSLMGYARFVHLLFAYVFTLSVLVRLYWAFVGNHHASWRAFIPWAYADGRQNALKMLRYYLFLGKQISYEAGHNAMAAMAYSGIFFLFLIQILSGFALHGQSFPGGFWDQAVTGPLGFVGNQNLRLIHHLIMWALLCFAINHIYSAWLMDIKERNGTMSGIFSGYRYIEPEDL